MLADTRVSPSLAPLLRLTCLGGVELHRSPPGGAPELVLGPGKPIAVVTYLHFAPGRTASREQLVDLFWAHLDPTAAKHAARQAIWALRRTLGPESVTTHNGDVTLAIPLESDREEFENAVASLDHATAVERYTGDFLPDFALPGALQFEHWVEAERMRLRLQFIRAAERLVRQRLSEGKAREARGIAERVRNVDPLNELGWRLLLEALLSSADRVTALAEADQLDRLLETEERQPEPGTAALLALVRDESQEHRAASTGTIVAELVGREREFALMLEQWETVRKGHYRHLHVRAAAGLGKTRLLNDVAARLRASGARLAHTRANPGERELPYATAADVARALARLPGASGVAPESAATLVALDPTLSAVFSAAPSEGRSSEEIVRHRAMALADLVGAVTEEAPVALVIDDLHWMDEASLTVMRAALARSRGSRLMCLTASRPHANHSSLDGETIELYPLSVELVGSMVASLGSLPEGTWSDGFPAVLHAATAGSPLLVLETLLLALKRGTLELGESGWHCPDPDRLLEELTTGSALRHRVGELGREHSWLLLLLAAAGRPLTEATLSECAGRDRDAVLTELRDLESGGYVARAGRGWEVAHDEIADAAAETATDEARRAGHHALGRALAEGGDDSSSAMRRAAQHLVQAGANEDLAGLYGRWARQAWRSGDTRSTRLLARDLLGDAPTPGVYAALARAVPLHRRLGLTSRVRVAALLVALGLAATAAAAALRSEAPEAWLVAQVELEPGQRELVRVPIPPWRGQDTAVKVTDGRPLPWSGYRLPAEGPEGNWLATRRVEDEGGDELFLLRRGREPQRLTHSPNDDVAADWAPDGRSFVFATGRWDERAWYDLAVMDLATGEVRPLTRTADAEVDPRWSPDGSTIAFTRLPALGGASRLCLIAFGGTEERCVADAAGVLAWRSATVVLIVLDSTPQALAEFDIVSGALEIIDRGITFASRDGQWIAVRTQRAGLPQPAWYVYPVGRPEESRRIAPDSVLRFAPLVRSSEQRADYVERLTIQPLSSGVVPLGAPTRFEAIGTGPDGRQVPVPYVRWSVSDSSVASIDARVTLSPRREGEIVIRASAGGWRTDSLRVSVRAVAERVVIEESWGDEWGERWVPFGDPQPEVTEGQEQRRAFWNRGDGSHTSGVYSVEQPDGSLGLGVEADVSMPVTDGHWQLLQLTIVAAGDAGTLHSWDHRSGDPPFVAANEKCSINLPATEGPSGAGKVSMMVGQPVAAVVNVPEAFTGNGWTRIRLQIFPDGRCGLAVNGEALAVSDQRVRPGRRFLMVLSGNSVGAKMLVGPTRVWEGVRSGVRWGGS